MPTFSAPPLATPSATSTRAPLATVLPTRKPPGPRGHWLLGHLHEYRTGRLHFLEHLRETYGPISSYRLGPRRFVLVSEPDVIEQVYVHRNREFAKFYITRMVRDVFGNGLLTSSGEHWLRQRRLIQPTFAQQQLAVVRFVDGRPDLRSDAALAAGPGARLPSRDATCDDGDRRRNVARRAAVGRSAAD